MPDIDNPLPDVLRVKVDNMKNIDPIMTDVKKLPDIQDTGYAKDLAQKVEVVNKISHTITLVVMIVSSLLTITIINNTIQLVIQSRKEEIEIMRLMGVSNWYIKCPLVLQGAIYGFWVPCLLLYQSILSKNIFKQCMRIFLFRCLVMHRGL